MIRKVMRNKARKNMREKGIKHFNRKKRDGRSYFSHYWRKYC